MSDDYLESPRGSGKYYDRSKEKFYKNKIQKNLIFKNNKIIKPKKTKNKKLYGIEYPIFNNSKLHFGIFFIEII